jgi:hypothetical protein
LAKLHSFDPKMPASLYGPRRMGSEIEGNSLHPKIVRFRFFLKTNLLKFDQCGLYK